MIESRQNLNGAGLQTAGLAFGGGTGSPNVVAHSEYYDGTNWSTSPNIGSTRYNVTGAGTATAALMIGGQKGPVLATVEEFTGDTTVLNYKTITTS